MTLTVKVGELRNRLSAYLRKVRQGAEIVIADRETPIGRLVPYEKKETSEAFELLPPRNGWGHLPKIKFTAVAKNYHVVDDLIAQRRKR